QRCQPSDSTACIAPQPSAFQGFAVGAVPPNCAIRSALPMSSLTAAGKVRKSRLEDPTQRSGFSSAARTRRTTRLSQFWDSQASEDGCGGLQPAVLGIHSIGGV